MNKIKVNWIEYCITRWGFWYYIMDGKLVKKHFWGINLDDKNKIQKRLLWYHSGGCTSPECKTLDDLERFWQWVVIWWNNFRFIT